MSLTDGDEEAPDLQATVDEGASRGNVDTDVLEHGVELINR
jgi:hypothetical protein